MKRTPKSSGPIVELQERLFKAEQERDALRATRVLLTNRAERAEAELAMLKVDWDDAPLPEDEQIKAAFPTRTEKHELYGEAMRLVGARRSKGGLVELVNWLLARIEKAETGVVNWRKRWEATDNERMAIKTDLDDAQYWRKRHCRDAEDAGKQSQANWTRAERAEADAAVMRKALEGIAGTNGFEVAHPRGVAKDALSTSAGSSLLARLRALEEVAKAAHPFLGRSRSLQQAMLALDALKEKTG